MPRYVILKTQVSHYRKVLKHAKHATDDPPSVFANDVVLIHCEAEGRTVPPRVTHRMDCQNVRPALPGESRRLFGRSWRWIIDGKNLTRLASDIPINRFGKASGKNYGQGAQRFVYLDPEDVAELQASGLL